MAAFTTRGQWSQRGSYRGENFPRSQYAESPYGEYHYGQSQNGDRGGFRWSRGTTQRGAGDQGPVRLRGERTWLDNSAVAKMSFGWVGLVATPKSHPFEERRIKVNGPNDPVKIGRAVARIQATQENAVFDCKVLSRNHAILWYRDGEFWLKDTKSSNGTFVNNEKLQQLGNGRDTDVRRVFSGDIIQLGVEIVENANKVPVVYGCIYAVMQCFTAEGKLIEITGTAGEEGVRTTGTLVSNRKLFQMQQYVSEAQHREKQREDKIAELMSIIAANEQAAETAWKALVNEDRLLARIEALEAQLSVLSNNNNPDKQKEELLTMIDEKTKFEAMTKEMVRRLIEEVEETKSRLKDMERSLETTDQTCQQMRSKNEDLETVLAETTEMYDQKAMETEQLAVELAEKQKLLAICEEKITDLLQKNMKLSKSSVMNETASGLARLLANAVNNGSFIDAPELTLLMDTLRAAAYLPPVSRESSEASDSELGTQLINGFSSAAGEENSKNLEKFHSRQSEDKSVESYLKIILELQAKNRDLELSVASLVQENQENSDKFSGKMGTTPLELSPMENVSFFPENATASTSESFTSSSTGPFVQKQQTVVRMPDLIQNWLLLLSLVPLLALILSVVAPIHNRLTVRRDSTKKED
ncbi:unnamed protein product [Caenorhabditis sp. 36 PRJEB53466]|nr:unnamed protein product [Caenorhabditis sp. 36 PRJEB53466]